MPAGSARGKPWAAKSNATSTGADPGRGKSGAKARGQTGARRRGTFGGIDGEEDDIRPPHRPFRLVGDHRAVRIIATHGETAGIDEDHLPPAPVAVAVDAVAR